MANVTDIVVQPGVFHHNVGSHLSHADQRDYFFMRGIKECIDGSKNLLAIVEPITVNPSNIGTVIGGARPEDYYVLKALQELFDALGL